MKEVFEGRILGKKYKIIEDGTYSEIVGYLTTKGFSPITFLDLMAGTLEVIARGNREVIRLWRDGPVDIGDTIAYYIESYQGAEAKVKLLHFDPKPIKIEDEINREHRVKFKYIKLRDYQATQEYKDFVEEYKRLNMMGKPLSIDEIEENPHRFWLYLAEEKAILLENFFRKVDNMLKEDHYPATTRRIILSDDKKYPYMRPLRISPLRRGMDVIAHRNFESKSRLIGLENRF